MNYTQAHYNTKRDCFSYKILASFDGFFEYILTSSLYCYVLIILSLPVGLTTQVISLSTTSLTISWILQQNWTATAYIISYSNKNNTDCVSHSNTISGIVGSQTMYTMTGLEEATEYSITVTAFLVGGRTAVGTNSATTVTAG